MAPALRVAQCDVPYSANKRCLIVLTTVVRRNRGDYYSRSLIFALLLVVGCCLFVYLFFTVSYLEMRRNLNNSVSHLISHLPSTTTVQQQ